MAVFGNSESPRSTEKFSVRLYKSSLEYVADLEGISEENGVWQAPGRMGDPDLGRVEKISSSTYSGLWAASTMGCYGANGYEGLGCDWVRAVVEIRGQGYVMAIEPPANSYQYEILDIILSSLSFSIK